MVRGKFKVEIARQMLTLATSAFGLVAALAWNSFIQELVNSYIKALLPANWGALTLLIYALLVTILAVTVTYQLGQFLQKLESKTSSN